MVESVPSGVRGFTLVEALIATVLSTVVVMLVTSVFLVQNQFYSDTVNRSMLHESIRGATALVSSDLGGVSVGGILTAEDDEVVFRTPLLIGGVCGERNGEAYVFFPVSEEEVDVAAVKGFGIRSSSLPWTYTPAEWESIRGSSGGYAAQVCAEEGADTTGAAAHFYRLAGISSSPPVQVGDLIMLFREVELKLAPSTLVPGARAIYRGQPGDPLMEVATGLSAGSGFEYEVTNKKGYRDRVTGLGNLKRIERIRFSFEGVAPAARPDRDSLSFNLTRTVPLRDVR